MRRNAKQASAEAGGGKYLWGNDQKDRELPSSEQSFSEHQGGFARAFDVPKPHVLSLYGASHSPLNTHAEHWHALGLAFACRFIAALWILFTAASCHSWESKRMMCLEVMSRGAIKGGEAKLRGAFYSRRSDTFHSRVQLLPLKLFKKTILGSVGGKLRNLPRGMISCLPSFPRAT